MLLTIEKVPKLSKNSLCSVSGCAVNGSMNHENNGFVNLSLLIFPTTF